MWCNALIICAIISWPHPTVAEAFACAMAIVTRDTRTVHISERVIVVVLTHVLLAQQQQILMFEGLSRHSCWRWKAPSPLGWHTFCQHNLLSFHAPMMVVDWVIMLMINSFVAQNLDVSSLVCTM